MSEGMRLFCHIILYAMHNVNTMFKRNGGMKKALVIALFILAMVILSLLIARFQL